MSFTKSTAKAQRFTMLVHKPTAISLFAGAGGCSLGFKQAGFDDLIAAQPQMLAALKTHKKGLMQQLFPSPEGVQA
jgi:hypothetical protein